MLDAIDRAGDKTDNYESARREWSDGMQFIKGAIRAEAARSPEKTGICNRVLEKMRARHQAPRSFLR